TQHLLLLLHVQPLIVQCSPLQHLPSPLLKGRHSALHWEPLELIRQQRLSVLWLVRPSRSLRSHLRRRRPTLMRLRRRL
ncbi:hypothetical protein GCK32_017774, partial [Trichostrongylus colubriformis]